MTFFVYSQYFLPIFASSFCLNIIRLTILYLRFYLKNYL